MQLSKRIRSLCSEKEMSCLSRSSRSCREKELWCTDKINPFIPLCWELLVSKNWGEFQTSFSCWSCEFRVHDIRNTFLTHWYHIFLSRQQVLFEKNVPHECRQILTLVAFRFLLNMLMVGLHLDPQICQIDCKQSLGCKSQSLAC